MPDDMIPMLARLRADHDLELAVVALNGVVIAADNAAGFDVAQVCNTSLTCSCLARRWERKWTWVQCGLASSSTNAAPW